MNDHKIDCQRRVQQTQQNHGLIQDFDYEFGVLSPHSDTMEIWIQQQPQQVIIDHNHHQQQQSQFQSLVNHQNNKPSSTIISRFETPSLAFFANERCMKLHNYNSNNNNNSLSSQFPTSSSSENYSINDQQTDPSFRPNNNSTSPQSISRQFSLSLKENSSDYGGFSQFRLGSSHHNQEKHTINNINNNSASNCPVNSSKTRIRWTQDLHEKFVECINRLGGAEKATPKAILRLMDSEGLTIFHVKSHLQKYRIAKYLPDSSEGKFDKRSCTDVTPQLESTSGLQIKEALQLQLDVQRRLHEQLEIQRNLQLQIEEQGKQLKMMFDMQQKTSNSLFKSQSSDISSSSDEAPTAIIDNIQASIANENTQFPSKIS